MQLIKYIKGYIKFRKEVINRIHSFYNFNNPDIWELTTRVMDEDVIYYLRNQFNKKNKKSC